MVCTVYKILTVMASIAERFPQEAPTISVWAVRIHPLRVVDIMAYFIRFLINLVNYVSTLPNINGMFCVSL